MSVYLYLSTVREFLRFKRLFPWILLSVAGMVLALVWGKFDNQATQEGQYVRVMDMLVFHILALAAAIFSTAIISQEVEQKTIVYLLTRPVQRWKLLLFRYLAAGTVVTIVGVGGALLVSAGVYKAHFLSNPLLVKDSIALAYGAFSYCALFLLVSLLLNRAMIVCLLFAFGWETIVPNMPGEMYRLSILSHLTAISDHPSDANSSPGGAFGLLTTNAITPGAAYVTLFILVAVLLTVSATWFTRFEYVPREDAE